MEAHEYHHTSNNINQISKILMNFRQTSPENGSSKTSSSKLNTRPWETSLRPFLESFQTYNEEEIRWRAIFYVLPSPFEGIKLCTGKNQISLSTMEIKHVYIKQRSEFGKQCFFEDVGPNVEENIFPDPSLTKEYLKKFMIHKYTQKSTQFALHEVQTTTRTMKNVGLLHLEGSWPKEIDPTDMETITRFRRRVAKTDNWISSMIPLMETMESYILQNNAVNIHEYYFDNMIPTELKIPPKMRIVKVYSDQESNVRPVNYVSWSTDTNRLAVVYCFKNKIELPPNFSSDAYIWDVDVPKKPIRVLKSVSAPMTIEFNPRDPSLLISGLMSGQVCSWDTRTGDSPVQLSKPLKSHRNPANQALWISSKTNTEFFSSSKSGTVKWWDTRNMRSPTEVLVMDLEDPDRGDINAADGILVLQYESTMGSRFLAGLESGTVVNVNRKAILAREKLHTRFNCHSAPILSIDRNPASLKNFLTVGDWHAKVWAEETKENYLIKTARKGLSSPTGGCWSKSRMSVFFTIDTEGWLDAYDILQGTMKPLYGIRLCEKALTTIKPHDDGQMLAVGSSDGNVYVVQCDGLLCTTFPNDKQMYATHLDKCSRYEKLADARQREIRMTVAQTPVQSTTEVEPAAKPKSRDKLRETRERVKIREPERDKDKTKDKDTARKSRVKKSMHRETPFAHDATVALAEKQYFIKVATEREAYSSEESREIEDLYRLHRKAEQDELEAKATDSKEGGARKREEKARKRPRLRRLRTAKSPGARLKIPDSLEKIGALIEAESVKSEDFADKSGKKRRALSEIPLKICPMGVCKPKVCCADVLKAEKEQRELEKSKESGKKQKMARFIEEEDTTPRQRIPMPFREWQKWQSKMSEMIRRIPERTELQKKRILLGMSAPPNVLAQDVQDAKRYLTAWRETVLPGSRSVHRSRSLSPKRKIGEGEKDDQRMVKKISKSDQDLANTVSRSTTFDNIIKMSAKIAEVKSKIPTSSKKTPQTTSETVKKEKDEERVYPRISEAYFPKYPE